MKAEEIKRLFVEELSQVSNLNELNNIRIKYLGKSGKVQEVLHQLKDLPNEQKKEFGAVINQLKQFCESSITEKQVFLNQQLVLAELEGAPIVDLTQPLSFCAGSLHPITITQKKLVDVFKSMGFVIEDSQEIETEYNNFEAVNIPKHHPARDMQDTFFLSNGQVLRTHTSSAQNKVMKKYGAPLKAVFPGRCFRNEEVDASHDTTFFQTEGMMIDKNISISNLIYFMKNMLTAVFEKDINVRLRPGFFPFVEPGFELDISCPYCEGVGCRVCKGSGWIELCPCGMIHPSVLEMGGIDSKIYQGFAFGLGLSRLTMMNFEINDVRVLNSGNIKELKQSKIK